MVARSEVLLLRTGTIQRSSVELFFHELLEDFLLRGCLIPLYLQIVEAEVINTCWRTCLDFDCLRRLMQIGEFLLLVALVAALIYIAQQGVEPAFTFAWPVWPAAFGFRIRVEICWRIVW